MFEDKAISIMFTDNFLYGSTIPNSDITIASTNMTGYYRSENTILNPAETNTIIAPNFRGTKCLCIRL